MSSSDRRILVYEKLRLGLGIAKELEARGCDPVLPFGPESCLRRQQPINEDDFIELARGFSAVVGASAARISRRVMENLPDLKLISKIGIGYEVIDVDAATSLGIQVTNTPSLVEIDSVAEHAIGLMLAAAKRLDFYTPARMSRGQWHDPTVNATFLRGKTVGIVGYGRIGRAVIDRLQGWGVHILVSDVPGRIIEDLTGVTLVDLNELLASSDFISLHMSTVSGAPALIGRAELNLVKATAVLVNTSRGSNIDQAALYEALSSGRLLVAALDVFHPEPPVTDDPMLKLANIIATPHLGAVTPESETDMERMAAENVQYGLDGSTTQTLVNREVLHSRTLRVKQASTREDESKTP